MRTRWLRKRTRRLSPVHPGEILEHEFLAPMGLTANRVAKEIGVPSPRINDIVLRKRAITAETALRLGQYFGTSATFWLGLQLDYDLDVERDRLGDRLARVPRVDLSKPYVSRGRRRTARSGKARQPR